MVNVLVWAGQDARYARRGRLANTLMRTTLSACEKAYKFITQYDVILMDEYIRL
jgi:hypothetical protein